MARWLHIVCALVVAACGSAGEPLVDSGFTSLDAGTDAGLSPLWPVGATRVDASSHAGYFQATCGTADGGRLTGWDYSLTLPEGRLQYEVCLGEPLSSPQYAIGERVLDATGLGRFDLAMRGLARAERQTWSDVPRSAVVLTTPAGVLRYDDEHSEPGPLRAEYVSGIYPLFSVLEQLAGLR